MPQDDTGSAATGNETSGSNTTPTTDDPSTTSPTSTMTSTTDPSTDPSTDSMTATSPTDTTDDPSGSSSSADSTGTGTGTGTDTSGTDSSGSSDGSSSESGSTDDTGGVLPTGAECVEDNDCQSGVCWDFSDYDQFCFGTACSVECATDDECFEAFEAAGAQDPEASFCGEDGRCWVVGTGFGAFACAMEPAAALGH